MNFKKLLAAMLTLGILFTFPDCVLAKRNAEQVSLQEYQEIKLSADNYIIDLASLDVTGDGVADAIYLVGHKQKQSDQFADHLTIMVRNGATNSMKMMGLDNFGGYEGKIFVGDFTGDKINDIMISAPTGGSGGIVGHVIVNFSATEPIFIFSEKDNQGAKFTGKFIDGYKAELINENTNRHITIDLTNKKDIYVKESIYNKDGKILKEIKPISYPFSALDPIDLDHDGVYELTGIQRVIGAYGADGIGNVYSLWKYENGQWNAKRIEVSSYLL